jgi:phosphoribosylformylglycinamidine synthase
MKARVTITLKNGVLDPQGKAIHHALEGLGFGGGAGWGEGDLCGQEEGEDSANSG